MANKGRIQLRPVDYISMFDRVILQIENARNINENRWNEATFVTAIVVPLEHENKEILNFLINLIINININ